MCPSLTKPAHVPDAFPHRFTAATAAPGQADETNKTKPANDQCVCSIRSHDTGSRRVAVAADDPNCEEGGTSITSTSPNDAKTGRASDFLHLLTSIDQLKKSLQDEEASDGQDEKSRLQSSTTALTSICMAKIKESLRQEQQTRNDEEPRASSQAQTTLDKPHQKSEYARIRNADRSWKKNTCKKKPEAVAQWHLRQEHRPTSLIDQWENNNRNNLQANSSVRNIDVMAPGCTSETKSKIKRVGASMA